MAILGIGADVVYVPRIINLVQRRGVDRFAARILNERELRDWKMVRVERDHNLFRDAQYLAVRWAVKEAAYKALYPTFRPVWKDLTYERLSAAGVKPTLSFHPKDQTSLPGAIHCSISHDGDYVFATVVVEV
ncbi:4'-phosphopantetheinyl transferase [Dendrothele bispora CBS 962.96]|uniref:4'-phosphopantetheinyl transferase n=1 Tax=Dendrothele bispora (strain CBS 962.96) TaxID=1314807 RepID=A0A4S8N164_DENBC|nr:4'-phosphopantetheinyl transferase [Dendrothele bispora CBS 962.96]